MKKFLLLSAIACLMGSVQAETLSITLRNPNKKALTDAPVCIQVPAGKNYRSATVRIGGKEIPSQMDDLNGDGQKDELAFVVNIAKKGKLKAEIEFSTTETQPDRYPNRVHAQMWFKDNDKTRSYTEKKHIPTDTVSERVDNMYSKMMHHGPAFENEKVAYRVYFDKKQSTDLYGKRVPQLELADGLWYSSEVPALVKEHRFGDDIILVGQTISIGTLRGWDDSKDTPEYATSAPATKVPDPCMVMIDPFAYRQAHIVAKGPVRTVVDMNVEGWQYKGRTLNLKSRYILYAGNRECEVRQIFSGSEKDMKDLEKVEFVTGVLKVGIFNTDSVQLAGIHYFTDRKGLCASYGKDWPDGNHKLYPQMSAAALAVSIHPGFVTRTIDRKEQILFGIHTNELHTVNYRMAFCAPDKEEAPLVDKPWTPKRWFKWCKQWNKIKPLEVK
ncbi:MAG: DUF4861 family protein [Bacteroidales bacterium]|nr:DUF4861 family protein [Bacteroidales bacterium]